MIQPTKGAGPAGEQTIEQLQARYQALHTRKIQAETNLENARGQLDALKAEARTQYGTDDLDQLRKKLAEMKAENEQKRRAYQAALDKIDEELSEVDSRFSAVENSVSTGEES